MPGTLPMAGYGALPSAGYGSGLPYGAGLGLPYGATGWPSYGTGVQSLILGYWAAGQVQEAKAMAAVLGDIVPGVTLAATLESSPYRLPEQRQLMIDAFRGVGLPD